MRTINLAPFAALLILTGCGQQESADGTAKASANDAGGEAAAMADTNFKMKAGQYRSTISVQKMTAEGLPPQVAQMMPKQQTFEYCISEADAAMGIEGVKKQMAEGNCKYESFQASSGKVDAVFSCETGPGMRLRSSAKGTYTDNGSEVAVVADMQMAGGKAVHVEQTVKAQRIGECSK